MARYRKIDPRIWNDDKFSSLSHEAQRIFFFVLTHPSMTALGAFRISKAGMADELGLEPKGFAKPFQELLNKGLVLYDERGFLVFAKNFLKYNAPENPNVIKGWAGALDLLPECPLLVTVLQTAKTSAAATDAGSKAFDTSLGRVLETLSKRYPKPFAKGLANQEQEQEQEQELLLSAVVVGGCGANFSDPAEPAAEQLAADDLESTYAVPDDIDDVPWEHDESKPQEKAEEAAVPQPVTTLDGDSPSETTSDEKPEAEGKAKPEKKKQAKTFVLSAETIPSQWEELCHQVRPDLNPKRVFVNFRFYYTKGRGAGTMRSERGWNQCWANWVSREKEFSVRSANGASAPLPPHKDPAFHFNEEYYRKSLKPDGSVDWGD